MNSEDIKEVLRLPKMWMRGEEGGKRGNLRGADLSGADLQHANLRDADLRDADLQHADLQPAYLRGAYLRGADLRGAKGIIRVGPASDGYEFLGVQHDEAVWIKAGCRWFTANDARKHWQETRANTPLGRERMHFVDFIESHFKGEM